MITGENFLFSGKLSLLVKFVDSHCLSCAKIIQQHHLKNHCFVTTLLCYPLEVSISHHLKNNNYQLLILKQGLTSTQAKSNYERDGPNTLTPQKTTPEWVKFCHQLFGGFSMLLWVGSVFCYVAYTIEYRKNPDVLGDNVSNLHSWKRCFYLE